MIPCYMLTKLQTLFIATKFNDDARAKLVLAWHQLEMEKRGRIPHTFAQALRLAAEQQEQIEQQQAQLEAQSSQILQLTSEVLKMEKTQTYMDKIFACPSTVKTTVIAQDYGMSAKSFNSLLNRLGVQYRCGTEWILYAKYLKEGYVKDKPFLFKHKDGTEGVCSNVQWTQKGRAFLYHFLKEKNVLPLIESQR